MNFRTLAANIRVVIRAGAALSFCLSTPGCGLGADKNNGLIDIYLESYSAPSASFKLCLKSVHFKETAMATTESKYEIGKEVTLNAAGIDLATVTAPEGTYERVELALDASCSSGTSADVQNSNGSFASIEDIVFYFDGSFTYSGSNTVLRLNAQPILDALRSANSAPSLRNNAEAATGTF